VALLLGLAGAVLLIVIARFTGRGRVEDTTRRPGDGPGQKL
jgi:hypothetical protein